MKGTKPVRLRQLLKPMLGFFQILGILAAEFSDKFVQHLSSFNGFPVFHVGVGQSQERRLEIRLLLEEGLKLVNGLTWHVFSQKDDREIVMDRRIVRPACDRLVKVVDSRIVI